VLSHSTADDDDPGHDPVRWVCGAISVLLLGHGIHLLTGGTTGDSLADSPLPYLALGAMLAVRALVPRPRST
jgi:hypothetical protein